MPYYRKRRRRYYTKKYRRTYRKKRRTKKYVTKKKYRTKIPNVMLIKEKFAQRCYAQIPYYENTYLSPGVDLSQSRTIAMNNLLDPWDYTGGQNPLMLNQLGAIYKDYRVRAATIWVEFIVPEFIEDVGTGAKWTTPITVGMQLSNISGEIDAKTNNQLGTFKGMTQKTLMPGNSYIMKRHVNIQKWLDNIDLNTEPELWGTMSATTGAATAPTTEVYMNFFVIGPAGSLATMPRVSVRVKVIFFTEFFEPRVLTT